MSGEKIIVVSVTMNEGILQAEGCYFAFRAGFPGQQLCAGAETPDGPGFLDDDHRAMSLQRIYDTGLVEWLHRMHRGKRYAFPHRLASVSHVACEFHDR